MNELLLVSACADSVELASMLEHLEEGLGLLDAVFVRIVLGVVVRDGALHGPVHHQVVSLYPFSL
jgi:hypothetical protein